MKINETVRSVPRTVRQAASASSVHMSGVPQAWTSGESRLFSALRRRWLAASTGQRNPLRSTGMLGKYRSARNLSP